MLYNLALRRNWVHDLQHITFFLAAMLFWWHVIGAGPHPRSLFPVWARMGYLLGVIPLNMMISVAIAFSSTVILFLLRIGPADLGRDHVAGSDDRGRDHVDSRQHDVSPGRADRAGALRHHREAQPAHACARVVPYRRSLTGCLIHHEALIETNRCGRGSAARPCIDGTQRPCPRRRHAPADGGARGAVQPFAWTEPEPMRAGDVHVTLAVTTPPPADAVVNNDVVNNLLEQPIDGAEAVVTFRPADGGAPVQLAAQPGTLNAFYLEADTRLPAAGRWTIEVAVSGPDGAGKPQVLMWMCSRRGINRWLIFGGLGLFLAVLVAIGLWARWPDATRGCRDVGTVTAARCRA